MKKEEQVIRNIETEMDVPEIEDRSADEYDIDDLERMYEESFKQIQEGSVIDGKVVSIFKDEVLVDIGYKSEGTISVKEFSKEELSNLKTGDVIKVYLEEREDAEGNLVISKEKADKVKVWDDLKEIEGRGEALDGKVISRIKGGMIVDVLGIKAFLPGSQIDLRPVRNLDQLIGKTLQVKILKINHKRGNLIISRRAILEETAHKKRKMTLASLEEGQVVAGTVKNITEYGVFVGLGGIDGLLHITDISWGRVNHPSELFMIGDKIEVMILKYNKETGRVSLGLKQKTPDPWIEVEEKYPKGTRIKGKVISIMDYGVFVEIENGIEGLVHISEMSWGHEVRHPSKMVSVGDIIDAVILSVDKTNRKISLGIKQIEPNPWDIIEERHPIGSKIKGIVKNLTDFGVFVGLEEGIDGLIHISDLSWTKHIKHPSEIFKKGDNIDAVIMKIDKDRERLSLSYKHLVPDSWEEIIPEKYRAGDNVKGKITKITDFGIFIEIDDGIEGLVHVSESGIEPPKRVEDVLNLEDEIWVKITRVDQTERKIALSIKEYNQDKEEDKGEDKIYNE
ncbi:MAG: 30S ribosomal protein S1 [Nitrospirota bacterium]